MSLDDKLRRIKIKFEIPTTSGSPYEVSAPMPEDAIAHIKQAFADEIPMSGEVFYFRYITELNKYLNNVYGAEQNCLDGETEQKTIPIMRAHEAAYRAAGKDHED